MRNPLSFYSNNNVKNLCDNPPIDMNLRKNMKRLGLLLLFLTLLPSMASAWWSDDWGYKKKIGLDMQKIQQEGVTIPSDAFALIRLHTGNFSYFLDFIKQ